MSQESMPERVAIREGIERIVENELRGVPSWRINLINRLTDAAIAAIPSRLALDLERVRVVFHEDYGGDGYCGHKNQHRTNWDCQTEAVRFIEMYNRVEIA